MEKKYKNIRYRLNDLLDEIEILLKSKMFLPALNSVLVLPDICSILEYGQGKNENGNRYKKWCNEWLTEGLPSIDSWHIEKEGWGGILYSLRCGILHEERIKVKGLKQTCYSMKNFQLFVDYDFSHAGTINKTIVSGYAEGDNAVKMELNLLLVVNAIYAGVKKFMYNNPELSSKYHGVTLRIYE